MRIKFTNFRCYLDREFLFPDKGLILLAGQSGVGKTTILEGIHFALYGDVRKPYSFGMKTCRVELEIGSLSITRQRSPNRLVVNGREDKEAQGYLNKIMCQNQDEFLASSYIKQKAQCSIISMTPSKQMDLIEKLAFSDIPLDEYKVKIQKKIKETNNNLNQIQTEMKFTQEQVMEKRELVPPQVTKPVDNVQSWKENRNKINTELKESEEEVERLRREYTNVKIYLTEVERLESLRKEEAEHQKSIQKEIKILGIPWGGKDREDYEEELEKLIEWKKFEEDKKRFLKEKKDFEAMKEEEISNLRKELENIGEVDEEELEKYQKITSQIQEQESIESNVEQLQKKIEKLQLPKSTTSEIEEKISKLKEEKEGILLKIREFKVAKELQKCPSCETNLRVVEGKIICFQGDEYDPEEEKNLRKRLLSLRQDIEKLEKELVQTRKNQTIHDTLRENLKEEEEKLNPVTKEDQEFHDLMKDQVEMTHANLKRREQISKQLEAKAPTSSLLKMFQRLEKDKKDLLSRKKTLVEPNEKQNDPDGLKSYIEEHKQLEKQVNRLKRELKESKFRVIRMEEKVAKMDGAEFDDISEYEIVLEEEKKKLDELKKVKEENIKIAGEITKWKEYVKLKKDYLKWRDKKKELLKGEKIAEKRYAGALCLKDKSQHAHSLVVQNTIESINEHASIFLETMFVDHPMLASLQSFKEIKNKKEIRPQINVSITYRGCEYDSVDQLSGGEGDRVSLSFMLALNSMFNSRILLLDESISSLDADSSSTILGSLHEIAKDKLIIVVAHQITTGLFDEVISLI